jgi:hypothetical protein
MMGMKKIDIAAIRGGAARLSAYAFPKMGLVLGVPCLKIFCAVPCAAAPAPPIGGIRQMPIEGTTFAASLADATAPSKAQPQFLRNLR